MSRGNNNSSSSIPVSKREMQSLWHIFDALGGKEWKNNTKWPITDSERQQVLQKVPLSSVPWYGTKWKGGHLIALELDDNNLSGEFPSEDTIWKKLKHLRSIKMRYNPKVFSTTSTNKESVPTCFRKLKALRYIYFENTNIKNILGNQRASNLAIVQYPVVDTTSAMDREIPAVVTIRFTSSPNKAVWQVDISEPEMFMLHSSLAAANNPKVVRSTEVVKANALNATGPERVAAAIKLQRIYRGKLARRALRQLLRSVYTTGVEEGRTYYLNTKTGYKTFEKPQFLVTEEAAAARAGLSSAASSSGIMRSKLDTELISRYGADTDVEERYRLFFADVDTDGTGEIDIDEFTVLCAELGLAMGPVEIKNVMDELDTSGDGLLDQEELTTWLKSHYT